jgi:hypothetical protein
VIKPVSGEIKKNHGRNRKKVRSDGKNFRRDTKKISGE